MTTTSFFGGRPGVSHYTLSLPQDHTLRGDERLRAAADRSDKYKALKAAGYKERYFQFRNADEKGKAEAKVKAEAERDLWKHATGIELGVYEGCFL